MIIFFNDNLKTRLVFVFCFFMFNNCISAENSSFHFKYSKTTNETVLDNGETKLTIIHQVINTETNCKYTETITFGNRENAAPRVEYAFESNANMPKQILSLAMIQCKEAWLKCKFDNYKNYNGTVDLTMPTNNYR